MSCDPLPPSVPSTSAPPKVATGPVPPKFDRSDFQAPTIAECRAVGIGTKTCTGKLDLLYYCPLTGRCPHCKSAVITSNSVGKRKVPLAFLSTTTLCFNSLCFNSLSLFFSILSLLLSIYFNYSLSLSLSLYLSLKLCYATPWPKSIVGVDMRCGMCQKHFMTHDPSYGDTLPTSDQVKREFVATKGNGTHISLIRMLRYL